MASSSPHREKKNQRTFYNHGGGEWGGSSEMTWVGNIGTKPFDGDHVLVREKITNPNSRKE